MIGTVIAVSSWVAKCLPKSRIYHVTVELEDGRKVTFFKDLENEPPAGLWEGEQVEVIFRRHKEDNFVLPFIVYENT